MITAFAFVCVAVISYLFGKMRGFVLAIRLGALLQEQEADPIFDAEFVEEQRRQADFQ